MRKVTGIVTAWTGLLSLIDGIDPYTVSKGTVVYNVDTFPAVSYLDIVNYLVFGPNPFTMEGLHKGK